MKRSIAVQLASLALNLLDFANGSILASRASPDCPHPTAFMSMKIDHGSSNNATFQQKYQIVDDYYKPRGPILYQHGAEGPYGCVEESLLTTWAQDLGALVVSSEHRFFGESLPNNDTNLANRYKSLTVENVFGDSIAFMDMIRQRYPKAGKAVITGGSYPGFMSAVARLNHPDIFYAAVARAAETRCLGEPSTDPYRLNHYEWLSKRYSDLSVRAAANIKSAFRTLADGLTQQKIPQALISNLSLCSIPPNMTEYQAMVTQMVEQYSYISQYSMARAGLFEANSLPALVNASASANTDLEVLQALVKTILSSNKKTKCWDYHLSGFETIAELTPWFALVCRYLPADQTFTIPNNTIFPPIAGRKWNDTAFGMGICPSLGVPMDNIPTYKQLSERYHYTVPEIEASTRILFPQGEYDPISGACGPAPFNGPGTKGYGDKMASRVMTVSEGGHAEDGGAPYEGMKEGVRHAQQVQLQILKGWLGVE